MNKVITSIFLILNVIISSAQLPGNSLRGKVTDSDNNLLPGATVIITGTSNAINANESGEYLFNNLPAGALKVLVSYVGYKTLTVDFNIQPGENNLDLTLEIEEIALEAVTVNSQKREQQVLDVPITMTVIGAGFINDNSIDKLDELSEFVPGLQIRMQGNERPSFVIRGLTSDEVSPAAQPRISVFYNNVPISRTNGAAMALFDMQQVDVLKGPQGTLFGRGAEMGAINYISNKPVNNFGGYLSAGIGNYQSRELKGAINIPVIDNKLFVRIAGIYDYNEGYIENTFGDNLNGNNTIAGRLSASFVPDRKNKFDFVFNYQKDDNPGLGFMSMIFPNREGSTDPFDYVASLEQGDNLAIQRDLLDATLTMKHLFNENNYLTSVSSYRNISGYTRWDGDGTAAAAIDMSEDDKAGQFFQELRYNYAIRNKLNGSIGGSYWHEKASQDYWFSPNEQNMVHLFFNTGFLVMPDGQPVPMTNLPDDPMLGPLAGLPLGTNHQEENYNDATNQSLEFFADANYQLTEKLSITAGARLINEWISLSNSAQMTGGEPSLLGNLSGSAPNLFFRPSDEQEINLANTAVTYRGGLKYTWNTNFNLFVNYSRGRRPEVLQFTSTGEEQVLDAEIVNSFDLGLKAVMQERMWFDIGLFYYTYLNFQSSAWVADPGTGEFNYIVKDGGKASGYGAEANVRYIVVKGLQLFANYAYIHARFADKDADGSEQEYAGNMFRLTPDHSLAIGLNANFKVTDDLRLFLVPSFAYKSSIFFEDANDEGMDQEGFGLLNINAGVGFKAINLSLYVSNLLGEEYIISKGNTGSLFGDPTQIPGAPRMFGTRLSWNF